MEAISGTSVLPTEIQLMIIYKFKGLQHPAAICVRGALDEVFKHCLKHRPGYFPGNTRYSQEEEYFRDEVFPLDNWTNI